MEKEILSCEIVDIVDEYGIEKTRERVLGFGTIHTWYDVCLERGEGDIVASFRTLKEARRWAKEN